MKSSDLEKVEGLIEQRKELLRDIKEVERAIREGSTITGIHFGSNRCVLEANWKPLEHGRLIELSNALKTQVAEHLREDLASINSRLKALGVVIDD
jgi:hypothetical protein